MKIHIELLDRDRRALHDAIVESPALTIGGDPDTDDFVVDGLSSRAIQVIVAGRGLWFAPQGGERLRIEQTTEVVLGSGRRLRITPYPPPVIVGEGGCPKCGSKVQDTTIGGAYRSMARRQRDCSSCGGALLDLEATEGAIGAFADASRHDWVHVGAAMFCPRCRQQMTRVLFTTARGRAHVERCAPCRLVFLEKADRARLRGDATPG